jgi:hypothetical protein
VILVGDHAHATPYDVEQLAGPQQEVGILGPPESLVADGERLLNEDAVGVYRGNQCRNQRAVEVVGHHDRREAPARESKGRLVLGLCYSS